jgi:hypothetical protein
MLVDHVEFLVRERAKDVGRTRVEPVLEEVSRASSRS